MELAVRVLCVDYVVALGRFVIAFNALRPDRRASQRDLVGLEGLAAAQQDHGVGRFYNDDLVGQLFLATIGLNRQKHESDKADMRP